MKIKAMAFDMDGTLLNNKHQIHPDNLKALKKAQDAGIEIVLASGRAPMRMRSYAEELGVRYIVCFNGGTVIDLIDESTGKEKVLRSKKLEHKDTKALYDFSKKHNLGMIAYIDGIPRTRRKGLFAKFIGESQGIKIEPFNEDELEYVDKVFVGALFKRRVTKIRSTAHQLFGDRMEIVQSNSRSMEFNPKGVHKAAGLDVVAKKLNIKPTEFMVFGDGGNDIEMFKWSTHGVAMENAREELIPFAKIKTGDNNSNGISKVILDTIKANG